ncbi:MAG: hypothetical protein LBC94_02905 [Desulfovibrio sp.]|jgi:hypothetical protein|nr:hypothetical protein [Desulfovibrio sp.]
MRNCLAAVLCLVLYATVCGPEAARVAAAASPGKGVNAFNPYMNDVLPDTRRLSAESEQMIKRMGASAHRIEGEIAYRRHWREELYPIVFGDARALHEILVLLDFAAPQSEKIWQAVAEAARSLSPARVKIAVFARSGENYGTDLMGFAIWLSHSRPDQAMPWLSHALARWNAVKVEQKRLKGRAASFNSEYDATAQPSDYPMLYEYMSRLRPAVAPERELEISKYCYDAGNVNLYQAVQISGYYGVKSLPAVIVDGKPLAAPSAAAIAQALQ